jgi:hypothetical protein
MDKAKLSNLLEYFSGENSLSADLYFVMRNQDNEYELFSTTPDRYLIEEMIEAYSEELTKYGNPYSPFELHSVYTDNENNWNYLYFDTVGTTKIANEIFAANVKDARPYSKDFGDFSSIFGFVIDLYSIQANETVRIFKKAVPVQAMKRSKVFGISIGDDGTYKQVEKDAVFFQKNIDLFRIKDKLIIRTFNVYENSFKFDEILKRRAQESLKILLKIKQLEFTDSAIAHIEKLNNTKRKKLINCVINNRIIDDEKFSVIKSQSKRYLKHEYKITESGKILINTKKDVDNLITILNREINKNSATNEVFHTPTKKLLSIYIPRAKEINPKTGLMG